MKTRVVGFYLFDEVEVLDFAGPFEVFSTASRVATRIDPGRLRPFDVVLIADARRPVTARGGLVVTPHFTHTDHPPLDVLIVPGGVVEAERQRPEVIEWLRRTATGCQITASVCTGAFLLAQAGLLHGQPATTHWEDIAELRSLYPEIDVRPGARWIDTGPIVTAAGISAGIDMALHLVARLEGEALATRTARQMEYDWHPGGNDPRLLP